MGLRITAVQMGDGREGNAKYYLGYTKGWGDTNIEVTEIRMIEGNREHRKVEVLWSDGSVWALFFPHIGLIEWEPTERTL